MEDITSVLTITEDTVESASSTQDSSSVTSTATLTESTRPSSSQNQLSSRASDYDVVRATNAILVGAAAYRDPGFFAGRDGNAFKVSIGPDFYFDGTTLTVPGISVDSIDIGGSDATSFHVDVDGNMWTGAATYAGAPMKISSAGAVTATTFTATNPSTVNVGGTVATMASFTAGQAITSGMNVSIDGSDGKIYRTRVTAFGSASASSSTTTAVQDSIGSSAPSVHKVIVLSSTISVALHIEDLTSNVYITRIVTDPETSTITSITDANTNMSGTAGLSIDAVRLTDTSFLLLSFNSGDVYGRVISGLDTGITANARTTLVTGSGGDSGAVAYVSSTEAVAFFYVSATEVRALQVTISGTTVSAGTTSTVYATATTQLVNSAIRFGTTSTYFVCFSEGTTNFRGIAGTYSGGAMTMGSAVSIESYEAAGTSVAAHSDSVVLLAYPRRSVATATKVRCISVSGTVLTVGSAYSTSGVTTTSRPAGLTAIGAYTYTLGYILDSTTNYLTDLLQVVGTTVSQLGSSFSGTTAATEHCTYAYYHSPTSVCVVEFTGSTVVAYVVSMTNNYASWIGIANESIADAASGYVVTHGSSPGTVTTLAIGSTYYTDVDGAFTTLTNGARVGVAYTTTQLITRS